MSRTIPTTYGLAGGSRFGQYYRHSGQINGAGLITALLAGLIAGAILGAVYSAAVVFIPFIKLRGIACFGYGFALGAIPATLMHSMKVRSIPISLAVVGVVSLFSFYFAWGTWDALILRDMQPAPSAVRILTHPNMVYNIAHVAYDFGTWNLSANSYDQNSSNDDAVKGTFLLVIWALEAAIIFGCALLTTRAMLGDKPFCEKCNQWCGGARTVRLSAPTDITTLRSKLETGDFNFVAALPNPTSRGVFTYMQHLCPRCKDLSTLSVLSRTVTKDKKGRVKSTRPKTVINKLLVSSEDVRKIVPATPAVAAPEAPEVAVAPAPIAIPVEPPARKPMKSPQAL